MNLVHAALETAGVIFVEESGAGAGVRLRKSGRAWSEFLSSEHKTAARPT